MLTFKKLGFEDVKTDAFGGEVIIRVNAESVKHYARKVKLLKRVEEMKLSDDDSSAYCVAAGLMSICTNPSNNEYSFHDDQLDDVVNSISFELLMDLTSANSKLNPHNFESAELVKTMNAKKKSI